MIDKENLIANLKNFGQDGPFDHCIIDNFFDFAFAKKLESEFPDFNSNLWHIYDNAIEIKKTSNN